MRDAQRGERWPELIDERHVVESADRDVVGYPQSQLEERVVASERKQVVCGHHCGEAVIAGPKRQKATPALALGERIAEDNPLEIRLELSSPEAAEKAFVAREAGRQTQRACKMGDLGMATLSHVGDGQLGPICIVGDDPGNLARVDR